MSSIVTAASASAAGGKRRIVYVDSLATSFSSLSFCVSGTTRRTRAKLVAGSEELMAHTNTVWMGDSGFKSIVVSKSKKKRIEFI